jgi:hypothetical protein
VQCPYCGEAFDAAVDVAAGTTEYIEDCPVCCRPIVFRVATDPHGEVLDVELRRDDD